MTAALLSLPKAAAARRAAVALSVVAAAGVALDAIRYYRELDVPGNYYAWFLVGPFLAGLVVIGYASLRPAAPSRV